MENKPKFQLGDRVYVRGRATEFGPGVVRFIGDNTKINPGWWVGVELDKTRS
jgi:dynactin complex subunit